MNFNKTSTGAFLLGAVYDAMMRPVARAFSGRAPWLGMRNVSRERVAMQHMSAPE
ncbi:MAG TPA: hypothetical protein VMJ11_03940 [Paraburkholderia sp.]|uniref:hypothetical protein n=1 Tax=Paraburkholderia sp. TaxID=1926495 RepID=UPI002BFFAAD4|nr:hypothetical protein [Paraburkholderia sp.]HTR05806.1 hypothetical protein [Paraburkholderia sp.]